MEKTISVIREPRTWTHQQYGPMASVDVLFDDGTEGQVTTKPDFAAKHEEALMKLVNKTMDFQLEERGEYRGVRQYKIKDYPGKPTGQQPGRGGGGDSSSTYETSEDRDNRNRSIQAQKATAETLRAVDIAVRILSLPIEGYDPGFKTPDQALLWLKTKGVPSILGLVNTYSPAMLDNILNRMKEKPPETN